MIPKIIYMCHKELYYIKKYSKNWTKLNPKYKIELYDNALCKKFLLNEFSETHSQIFDFIPDGPIKADFWRCCILYKRGGVYIDADIEPLIPLRDYIADNVNFVTCISSNFNNGMQFVTKTYNMNPHFIMAEKGEKLLETCISKYLFYYKAKIKYDYWKWSICHFLVIPEVTKKKSQIIYIDSRKFQFILEKDNKEECEFNGKIVFNNRYKNYKDHKFSH